jgi:hypothetical protein
MLSAGDFLTKYKVDAVCISYDEIEALLQNKWIG